MTDDEMYESLEKRELIRIITRQAGVIRDQASEIRELRQKKA